MAKADLYQGKIIIDLIRESGYGWDPHSRSIMKIYYNNLGTYLYIIYVIPVPGVVVYATTLWCT